MPTLTFSVVVTVDEKVPPEAVSDRLRYGLLWVDGIGPATVTLTAREDHDA
jgi:hypothetical protein